MDSGPVSDGHLANAPARRAVKGHRVGGATDGGDTFRISAVVTCWDQQAMNAAFGLQSK